MSPFMALMLIGFAAVIVLALLLWTLLAPPPRRPEAAPREARSAAATTIRPTAPRATSNDEVRGARVRPPERRRGGDDAFEQFLRAERDDA